MRLLNAEQIGDEVASGTLTSTEAVRQLVAMGYNKADAREQVFFALGGDDVVGDDAQRIKNIMATR